jgi:serine/threonine-protein kinase
LEAYSGSLVQPTREVLASRYELGEVLGKGAHGVVYRGTDLETGSEVAVKVLRRDIGDDPMFAERLRREAEALRALHGSSAVVMRDFGEDRWGAVFLVMELLEGETLDDHLFELEDFGDRMSAFRLLVLLEPIARTLHLAHQHSIVHRDVKPGNIFLVGTGDTVRLMDFGLAKILGLADITRSGMVAGSPSYIAPELWRGEPVDHRIDIYSFSSVVFRALAGQPPFAARGSMNDLLTAVTTSPRPRLTGFRPDLGHSMDDWVQCALAAHVHQRYPDFPTLWTELVYAVQRGETPAAYRAREHFGGRPW